MKRENGVYTIPCKVNNLPLSFILDTGAGDVTISLTEASFMLKNGYLKSSDFIGTEKYIIANGNIEEGYVINIREIEIAGLKLSNIKASIVNSKNAPLLLGQSALSKLGIIQIDYSLNLLTIDPSKGSTTQNNTSQTTTSLPQSQTYVPVATYLYDTSDRYSHINYTGLVRTSTNTPITTTPDRNGEIICQMKQGEQAEILAKVNNRFYKVQIEKIIGFVFVGMISEPSENYISSKGKISYEAQRNYLTDENDKYYKINFKGLVKTLPFSSLYESPDQINSKIIYRVPEGKKVKVLEKVNNRYYRVKVGNNTGYIFVASLLD